MQGDSPNSNKSIPLLDRSQPCKIKMDIDITNYLDEFDWEDDVLSRNMVINNVDDNTNHMKRSSINKEKKGRSNIERESEVIGIIIR